MEKLGKDLKLLVEEYASTLKVQGKWNEKEVYFDAKDFFKPL